MEQETVGIMYQAIAGELAATAFVSPMFAQTDKLRGNTVEPVCRFNVYRFQITASAFRIGSVDILAP